MERKGRKGDLKGKKEEGKEKKERRVGRLSFILLLSTDAADGGGRNGGKEGGKGRGKGKKKGEKRKKVRHAFLSEDFHHHHNRSE